MMTEKILVIGATGSIGLPLVHSLADSKESVKAATRNPENYPNLENVEAIYFDYDKPESFNSVLDGVNRIFMITKPSDSEPDITLNPFIDQAKKKGIMHIVLVTALGVQRAGDELGYRRLEKHLIRSSINYTILRPGWFMQSLMSGYIQATIKQQNGLYLPASDAKVSLIDSCDIAAVGKAALLNSIHIGREYTLTGGEALSFSEIAAILSEVTQRNIKYHDVDIDEFKDIIAKIGGYQGPIELMERFFNSVRKGSFAYVSPAVSEVLQRDPIKFEQYSRENVNRVTSH